MLLLLRNTLKWSHFCIASLTRYDLCVSIATYEIWILRIFLFGNGMKLNAHNHNEPHIGGPHFLTLKVCLNLRHYYQLLNIFLWNTSITYTMFWKFSLIKRKYAWHSIFVDNTKWFGGMDTVAPHAIHIYIVMVKLLVNNGRAKDSWCITYRWLSARLQ